MKSLLRIPTLVWFILLFGFVTRLYQLHLPERYIFDEVYHVVTAKLIARNDSRAFEWWHPAPEPNTAIDWLHPPLAKYTQAATLLAVGETSFGWRLSSALTGVILLAAIYVLTQELFSNQKISTLATGLAALDGLLLVQSRVAMNDIHVTLFIVLALLSYWRYRASPSIRKAVLVGLLCGLALASKWSGAFVIITIICYEFAQLLYQHLSGATAVRSRVVAAAQLIGTILPISSIMYLASYWQPLLQGKSLKHLYQLHQQIWWYQTGLTATHPYQSQPWQWFFNLRPVWYHVEYGSNTIANMYAMGNPILSWLEAAVVACLVTLLLWNVASRASLLPTLLEKSAVAKKLRSYTKHLTNQPALLFLLLAYGMTWLPWILSPRILFYYHYTPAAALAAPLTAWWLMTVLNQTKNATELKNRQLTLWLLIAACVLSFLLWYPRWVGISVPTWFDQLVYQSIPSWK